MLDLSLTKLETAISRSGIPEMEILRAAGMCPRHMYKVRQGEFKLTKKAEKRILLAIKRMKKTRSSGGEYTDSGIPVGHGVMAQYRLALALIEAQGGVPALEVLSHDPSKRATADPDWMRAAGARRIALYIVNQYGNVPQAEVGRAVGMTKSAVHLAIREVEDIRDQAEVLRFLQIVEGAFQQ